MSDRLPEILEFTWPRPRLGWEKLLLHPLGFHMWMLPTKFDVPISLKDMFDRIPKILGVTWPRPHLLRKVICVPDRLSQDEDMYEDMYLPNLKSPTPVVLKLCSIVCRKLWCHVENYLCVRLAFPSYVPKCEVPSPSSFVDVFDCMWIFFRYLVT